MSLIPAAAKEAVILIDGVVDADGETDAAVGYGLAASVSVDVTVDGLFDGSVDVALEDSADGETWTELDSEIVAGCDTVTLTADDPQDQIRVSWVFTDVTSDSTVKLVAVATATGIDLATINLAQIVANTDSVPEVPDSPSAQDVVDALLALGLVTQAAPPPPPPPPPPED